VPNCFSEKVESLTFMLPFIAFILIFLAVTITIRVLAFMVKKALDLTILGTFDSFAGGLLGSIQVGHHDQPFNLGRHILSNLTIPNEEWSDRFGNLSFAVVPVAPAMVSVSGQLYPHYRCGHCHHQGTGKRTPQVILLIDNFDSFTHTLADYFLPDRC
jgi:membrane protein required for colicin V production